MAENNSSAPLKTAQGAAHCLPEPDAWRYTGGRGIYRYRGKRAGFASEYQILKPEPLYTAEQMSAYAAQAVEAQAPAAVAVLEFNEWIKREYPHLGPIGDGVNIAREAWSAGRAALAATPALPSTEDSSVGDLARHGMTPRDKGTQDQIAAVMLQHGTPEQQLQALATCCNVSPDSIKAMVAAAQAEVQAEPVAADFEAWWSKAGDGRSKMPAKRAWSAAMKAAAPQAQPADALDADTFWVAEDPDAAHDTLHDAVVAAFEGGGVHSGGFVEIGCSASRPNLLVRITSDRPFHFVVKQASAMAAAQEGGNAGEYTQAALNVLADLTGKDGAA